MRNRAQNTKGHELQHGAPKTPAHRLERCKRLPPGTVYPDAFSHLPCGNASELRLELPKHTFYVDNIFVYQPLPHVKSMYYLDVNFYRYFIGRDDQSVNEKS